MLRIIVIHEPPASEVDGIRLDVFHRGVQYEMGNSLGALFLAEGWGEPAPFDEPAMLIPMSEISGHKPPPPNLIREIYPPYYDAPPALAADRRRRRRDSLKKT